MSSICCSDCDFKAENDATLREHTNNEHFFKSVFSFIDSVKEEIREEDESYIEEKNNIKEDGLKEEYFEKEDPLIAPSIKKHRLKGGKLKCDQGCSYTTNIQQSLKFHIESHHLKILRFQCNLCDYKSYFKHGVQYHQKSHRELDKRVKTIGCDDCEMDIDHIHKKARNIIAKLKMKKEVLKKFKCGECKFATNKSKGLQNHVARVHYQVMRYACNICDYKAYYKKQISRHFLSHGKEKIKKVKLIGCSQCERQLEHHHSIRSIKDGKLKCNDCDYSTNFKVKLNHHKNNIHLGMVRFECSACDHKGYYEKNMKSHLRRRHSEGVGRIIKIGCEACQNNEVHSIHHLNQRNDLAYKCKEGERKSEFKCEDEDCDFSSYSKQSYKNHYENIHLKLLRFACSVCEYKSYFDYLVKQHLKTHTEEDKSVVKINEVKDSKMVVKKYKARRSFQVNDDETRKKIECETKGCDFTTFNALSYKNHYNSIHLKILNFGCNICDYKSYYRTQVKIHLKRHSDENKKVVRISEKPKQRHVKMKNRKSLGGVLKCIYDDCSYSTNLPKNLKFHVAIRHLDVKRFSCNLCDFASYFKQNVQRHKKKHPGEVAKISRIGCTKCEQNIPHRHKQRTESTEERKHKCTEDGCDFSTNFQQSLKNHRESVHLEIKRFSCNLCKHVAYHRDQIKLHQSFKHPNSETRILKIGCTPCEQNIEHKHAKKGDENVEGSKKCSYKGCTYSTNESTHIRYHIDNMHKNIQRFACSHCGYKSFYKQGVMKHMKTHEDVKTRIVKLGCKSCEKNVDHDHEKAITYELKCFECNETFDKKTQRVKHYKEKHPGKHIYKCSDCSYGSLYLPNVNTHRNSKHEKKEMQCTKCAYKTTWNTSFLEHMRYTHGEFQKRSKHNNGGKAILCDECGFSSYSPIEFERHFKFHNGGARIDTVSRMGTTFQRVTPLVRSYKTDVEKKYKCHRCDYSTEYASNVRVHVQTIHERGDRLSFKTRISSTLPVNTNKLSFKCNKCTFTTEDAKSLRNHIDSHV